MSDRVLILDFGSQFTQLIARRIREARVYCEIHPFNRVTRQTLTDFDPKALILSGGPASVIEMDTPRAPEGILDSGLPILGICYGQQTFCTQLGGAVESGHHREFGRAKITIVADSDLFMLS